MTPAWRRRMSWSGLWLGPAAWAINQQTNYALAPTACGGRVVLSTAIAAVLAIVAIAGGLGSLRAARMPLETDWTDASGGLPRHFVAWVGAGVGLVFALAVLNQLIATLILDGCLR